METPKEAAIRKAWIAEIGEEKYNKVKRKINVNGYLDENTLDAISKSLKYRMDIEESEWYEFFYRPDSFYRPYAIEGVEDNNGWHRVDEVGFPSEEGDYVFVIWGAQTDWRWRYEHQHFVSQIGITHWRKKETYPDPIY